MKTQCPKSTWDHGFFGKRYEQSQPIPVARESFLVREKGATDPDVVSQVSAFIDEAGYKESQLVISCDQGSPVKALAAKIASMRSEQTILEHSPVRSSGSNGAVERGIKEVEFQIRWMKKRTRPETGS